MKFMKELLALVEGKNSETAATLDSNGREVKLAKVNTGGGPKPTEIDNDAVYRKIRNTMNTKQLYKIQKSTNSTVWLDMIDKDGNLVNGHSGDRSYRVSMSAFQKDYQKVNK